MARKSQLTEVELVLMGKGMYRARKHVPVPHGFTLGGLLYGGKPGGKKRRRRDEAGRIDLFVVAVACGLLAFLAGVVFTVASALHVEHLTCTVESKDRTSKSDGSSDARLYTEDCGVLHVGDSVFSWHFSSADTYASIEEGGRYEFTTRGYRVPFFSMFPNVVEAERVG